MIRRLFQRILAWFRSETTGAGTTSAEAKPPKPKPKIPHAVLRQPRRERDHFGAHYYLGDLLGVLHNAFRDMPRLRKADREAYDLLRNVGVTVCSRDACFYLTPEPYILRRMPTFGGAYILEPTTETDGATIPARFVYYVKQASRLDAQNETVYRLGVSYDFRGHSVAGVFSVAVSRDGRVRPLCEQQTKVEAPPYSRRGRGDIGPRIPRKVVDYPASLSDLAADAGLSPEEAAQQVFGMATNISAQREAGLTVRVRKNQHQVAFAIDMERTPYFFSDREKTVTANGQTKKIFHIVRAHERVMAGGGKRWVKSHFRGLRQFEWNGYDVSIGMAGKHGSALSQFNIDPLPADTEAPEGGRATAADVSRELEGMVT